MRSGVKARWMLIEQGTRRNRTPREMRLSPRSRLNRPPNLLLEKRRCHRLRPRCRLHQHLRVRRLLPPTAQPRVPAGLTNLVWAVTTITGLTHGQNIRRAIQREASLPEGRDHHRVLPVPLRKHALNHNDLKLRGDPDPGPVQTPGLGADFLKIPAPELPRMHRMQVFTNQEILMFQFVHF